MRGDVGHTLSSRLAAAADNPFQLVSIRPFLDENTGIVDFERPYKFQTEIVTASPHHKLDHVIFNKAKISCADDICTYAVTPPHLDAKAWGMDRVLREALFEVARRPETANCRFIALTHPLLECGKRVSTTGEKTTNAIVLENTAAMDGAKDYVMVVKLQSAHELR